MKKIKGMDKEIEIIEKALKYIEKGYGKDKCKGYSPDCANCRGQILRGLLEDHLDLLKT